MTNIKGTVIHNETKLPMGNVHVINASRVKGTVTSPSGTFEIEAKVNDTLLFTYIGYENGAKVAKLAFKENISLKQAVLKLKLMPEADFDKVFKPEQMV